MILFVVGARRMRVLQAMPDEYLRPACRGFGQDPVYQQCTGPRSSLW